ncbi:MAG: DsbA family protein [Gemmatimonadales bacterium]
MNKKRLLQSVGVVLVAAVGTGWAIAARPSEQRPAAEQSATPLQGQPDPLIDQRTLGDPKAPITIYEASDFQCPYCREFWQNTLPKIKQEYVQTGKARIIFLNFPIPQIHQNAAAAHEFAMCAASQDRFWPIHDLLYDHQTAWEKLDRPRDFFMALADSAHLDRDSVNACVDSGAQRWLVTQEAQAIARSGVTSTPSFIVEGGLLKGAAPIDAWRPILDSLFLAKTKGK